MREALEISRAIEMTIQTLNANKEQPPWIKQAEARLSKRLQKTMRSAFNEAIDELGKKKNIPIDAMSRRQITQAILTNEPDVRVAIQDATTRSAEWGRTRVQNHLKKEGVSVDLGKHSKQVVDNLKRAARETSQRIVDRGAESVYESLADSYSEGLGIDEAANALRNRLDDFTEAELRTVARTEINSSQNVGRYVSLMDAGMEYHQWWTGDDDRVRGTDPRDEADHTRMHGEIVALGTLFSNEMLYPGNKRGPIKEWINCRCRAVPFIMPEGYMAPPGKTHFHEHELIRIEDVKKDPLDPEALEEFQERIADKPPQVREEMVQEYMKEAIESEEAKGRSIHEIVEEMTYSFAEHETHIHPPGLEEITSFANFGLTESTGGPSEASAKKALKLASNWISKKINPRHTSQAGPLNRVWASPVDSTTLRPTRASYNPGSKGIFWDGEKIGSFIHEYGHHIQDQDPRGVGGLVKSFFKRRTLGEEMTTIYSGTKEVGYKDKFINHYMGRVYGNQTTAGDEILSSGIQMMYDKSQRQLLYDKDPEYFRLILGIMRGMR